MNRFRHTALSLATPVDKPAASLTVEDITPPDNPRRLLGLMRRYLETGDGDVDLRDDVVRLLACIETLELAAIRLTMLAGRLDTTEEHLGLLQATVKPLADLSEHLLDEISEGEHEETSSEPEEFNAEAEAEAEFEAEAERVREEEEMLESEAHALVARHVSSRPFLTLEQITPPEGARVPLTYRAREWALAVQGSNKEDDIPDTLVQSLEAAELAAQQLMYLAVQVNPVLAAEAVRPMNAMALRLEQETLEADAANAD